jgi:uncharacterized protein YydD (DUF2326 family)
MLMAQVYAQQQCTLFSDILYNFAIGGNGSVFEGRGFDVIGQNSKGRLTFVIRIIHSIKDPRDTFGVIDKRRI